MPVIEASTVEEVTDLQIKWIQAGVKLIVIDSTSALMPSSFTEKGDIKQFGDTNQMGTVAKDLGKMCKMIQGINYSCAVVHISQVRVDIGAQGTTKPFKPVGGKEVEHTDSFRVRLAGTKATDKQILGKIQHGEVLFEEVIGYPVSWFVNKNKITGDTGIGKYDFYKKGDYVGVDRLGEVLEAAVAYGVVVQGGAWFTVYGEKIQARKNVIKYLRENPEVAAKMEQEVHDKSV
jgi:recombination protein RecA